MKKTFRCLLIACLAYGCSYVVVRARLFVVMREYDEKDEQMLVRRTGPGWDVRNDWRGELKNRLNPVIFVCFRPLAWSEDRLRGFRRPIRHEG